MHLKNTEYVLNCNLIVKFAKLGDYKCFSFFSYWNDVLKENVWKIYKFKKIRDIFFFEVQFENKRYSLKLIFQLKVYNYQFKIPITIIY